MYKCFIIRDNHYEMHLSLIDLWKLCRSQYTWIYFYLYSSRFNSCWKAGKNFILPHFVFHLYRTWIMYNYADLLFQVLRENRANWQRKDYNLNIETVIFDITSKIGNRGFVNKISLTSCSSIYNNTSRKILSFLICSDLKCFVRSPLWIIMI